MAKLIKRVKTSTEKVFDTADNLLSIVSNTTGILADVVEDYRKELKEESALRNTKEFKDAKKALILAEINQELAELKAETAKLTTKTV